MKDQKKINNVDLFSQPPLLVLTKGANISGGYWNLSTTVLESCHARNAERLKA